MPPSPFVTFLVDARVACAEELMELLMKQYLLVLTVSRQHTYVLELRRRPNGPLDLQLPGFPVPKQHWVHLVSQNEFPLRAQF